MGRSGNTDAVRQPVRARDERGASYSSMVAVVVVALLGVAGLVVDGGARATADRRAEQAASAAARAASDAGSTAAAVGSSGSPETMAAAARRSLAASGVTGTVTVLPGVVRVETTVRTPTVFLGLVGVNELSASATADAELRAS